MARVVVIGAGVAGLSVAARLAKLRHDVTLLERSRTVGGQIGSLSKDGFTFDTGPTVLSLPAVYRDTFRKSGRPLERELELVPIQPAVSYRFADGTRVDLPNASRAGRIHAIDTALGGGAGARWEALLRRGEAVWQLLRQPVFESAPGGWGDLRTTLGHTRTIRTIAPWTSLRRVGRRLLGDPRLQTMLEHQASYVGSDPRAAPGALAFLPYVDETFGNWYVKGGMHRLVEALHDRVLMRRVTVRTGVEVAAVRVDGERAVGVRLSDGELVDADVVVAAIDTRRLFGTLLSGAVAHRIRQDLGKSQPSPSVFTLLLALDGRTPGLGHRTVLFPADTEAELDGLFRRADRPVPEPTITITAPDEPAARPNAATEAWTVQVAAPVHNPDDGVDWSGGEAGDCYADQLLDVLAARGFDVRGRLRWRIARTPYDLQEQTGVPGGSAYGMAWRGIRSLMLRPANRSPVTGLFVAGASAHPGGGLPWVGLSAATVADMIGRA